MSVIFEKTTMKRYFDFVINFSFKLSKLSTGFAVGTYSICKDGSHVLYFDYDNFRFEWLLDELRHLRDKYKLSNLYIFRSSHKSIGKYKHHVVCFDKCSAREYNDIILSSNADMLFKKNSFFDLENSRVLRFSGKSKSQIGMPVYYGAIKSKYNKRNKSTAHIDFYERMFKFKVINRKKEDKQDDIKIISYSTQHI